MKQFAVVDLMSGLECITEWMEGANRNGRNGTEQIPKPPRPDILEREMRKDRKLSYKVGRILGGSWWVGGGAEEDRKKEAVLG